MNKKYRFFDFGIARWAALIGAGILCVYGLVACAHFSSPPSAKSSLVAFIAPSPKNRNTSQKSKAAAASARTAFASQTPNQSLSPDVSRSIGRRSSVDAGIRASLRMLSRLIKAYPDSQFWIVYWEASSKRGGKIQKYSTSYATFEDDLGWQAESGKKRGNDLYDAGGVVQKDIFVVAGHSGTFKDIQKRLDNPYRHITRRIGRQASVDKGNRASLRMLSRLIKAYPEAQTYEVYWSVRLNGQWKKTWTNYLRWENSVNREYIGETKTKVIGNLGANGVSDADIHAVARDSGSFEELQRRVQQQ